MGTQVAPPAPDLFTRGGLDAPDLRGASMVQKHAEKLQRAKEEAALAKLRAQWPELSEAVLVLALEDVDWDTDRATLLLHRFQSACGPQLDALAKKLKRARAEAAKQIADSKGANAEDASSSGSGEDSGSDDGAEEHRPRVRSSRRRDSKEKKGKKASRKEGRKAKHKKDKDKERPQKRGREERPKAKLATGASTDAFGKYGVVRETDLDSKRSEFVMWATEVKKVDIESLPKWEEKDMFRTYMEDFNTGTLPHKKYYDLDVYERRRAAKAAKRGPAAGGERSAFDDEAALKAERKAAAAEAASDRLRDAYNELKYTAAGKVADMREQEMTRMQMNLAYRTADFETARKLQSRLAPDDPFADPNTVKRLEK